MTKFSVIIPCYNVEAYLKKALDSIKNQTFNDFEVICINDGSTDSSLEIIEEYIKKDGRFKVYSQSNQGQGAARNKAIDISKGEYIVFLDPDDYIEPNALELLYSVFLKTGVPLIQFDYSSYDNQGKKLKSRTFKKQSKEKLGYKVNPNGFFTFKNFKKPSFAQIPLPVWNKAYSAEFIKKNNIKFAPTKNGEDHIFSLAGYLLANQIYYLPLPLYHYKKRADSACGKVSNNNFAVFENIKILKNFLEEHNLYNSLQKEFKQYAICVMNWHYEYIPEESAQKYLDKCAEFMCDREYKKFLKNLNRGKISFIEEIFSIKNCKKYGQKHKLVTILGISFVLKSKKNS